MCTAVACVGMAVWYRYCLKIYNSFKFVKQKRDWTKKDDDAVDEEDEGYQANPLDKLNRSPSGDSIKSGRSPSAGTAAAAPATGTGGSKLFPWFGGRRGKSEDGSRSTESNISIPLQAKPAYTTYRGDHYRNILYDGTVEVKSQLYSKRNPLEADAANKWLKRYIVLIDSHYIMFYYSQGEYKSSSTSSLCKTYRPLDLTRYSHRMMKSPDNNQELIVLSPLLTEDTLIELRCANTQDLDRLVKAISYFSKHVDVNEMS